MNLVKLSCIVFVVMCESDLKVQKTCLKYEEFDRRTNEAFCRECELTF